MLKALSLEMRHRSLTLAVWEVIVQTASGATMLTDTQTHDVRVNSEFAILAQRAYDSRRKEIYDCMVSTDWKEKRSKSVKSVSRTLMLANKRLVSNVLVFRAFA